MIKSIRYVASVLAAFILTSLLYTGCGGPAVSHTSISGEVQNVQHWRLEWVGFGDSLQPEKPEITGLNDPSKYTLEEYCTKYIDKIKAELAGKYNHSLAENFPEYGRIEVTLAGEKFPDYVPPGDTSQRHLYPDISPDGRDSYAGSGFNLGGALHRLFTDDDHVRGVNLKIFDSRASLAGEVFIGNSPDDRVKPEYVAEVINQILRTGRYKDSKTPKVRLGNGR